MKVKISPSLVTMAVVLLFSKNFSDAKIIISAVAATIHETGHLIAAKALKIPVKALKLNIFGANIELYGMNCPYLSEALLCFCGPLANVITVLPVGIMRSKLLLVFSAEDIDFFVAASLIFALLNLIPAENFDGGRILSSILLTRSSPEKVDRITNINSFIFIFILWVISVYFIIKTGSYLSLFVFTGALFSRIFISVIRGGCFERDSENK